MHFTDVMTIVSAVFFQVFPIFVTLGPTSHIWQLVTPTPRYGHTQAGREMQASIQNGEEIESTPGQEKVT